MTMSTTNKIVAISDPHLGQNGADKLGQYSLLSASVSDNLVGAFARAVAAFAGSDRYTLLVAGDFLDLSLAYAEDALTDLRGLLEALALTRAPDEIVYTIGNHDHHLWSLHSEDKRLLAPLRAGHVPSSLINTPAAKAMYQVTPAKGENFTILQPLVDSVYGQGRTKITIAYPSYTRPLDDDAFLYVTHGHLFGGLYTELSNLLAPKLVGLPHDRVAATVNHPLIEFIYWQLGEAGEGLGADGLVEQIYTDIQKGTLSKVRQIVARLVEQVLPHGVLWRVIGGWERRIVVDLIMAELAKELLSPTTSANASADRFADLETTRAGLLAWLKAVPSMSNRVIGSHRMDNTIVLYGHTHVRDDWRIPDTGVHSYNLGTWLVEPKHDIPSTGFLGIDAAGKATWVSVTR
jgi:UDP-2,3-diacylglucosamine pyrophosphatase LpxH